MKTIKLTENGVEKEYALTPIGKDLEIPTGISQCTYCNTVFRSFEGHDCKPQGKPITEWLKELPDGYRELALANFKGQRSADILCIDLRNAILFAFNWEDSKEGAEFWYSVKDYYIEKTKTLPPLPKPKFEVWKPKEGDIVHLIDNDGIAHTGTYIDEVVKYRCFKTYKEAIEAHEKALFNYEVEMFIKEKNEGWLPDWNKNDQSKYFVYQEKKILTVDYWHSIKLTSDSKLFKTRKIGEEVIAKFDNEKLLKYWI